MRIIINQGTRDLGEGDPETVAVFSLVQDFDDRQEVVFSGSMTEDDYDAIIQEMNERKGAVWS